MMTTLNLDGSALDRWMVASDAGFDPAVTDRCRVDVIQEALDHLDGVEVASVTVNTTGRFEAAPVTWDMDMPLPLPETVVFTNLPDFCDVRVRYSSPGGHVVEVTTWVPLQWNMRFLGLGGGGNRTSMAWIPFPGFGRVVTLPMAVSNGFASAVTDAGIKDRRFMDWAFKNDEGDLDRGFIQNWAHRSTHEMTLIGKAVAEAIHGSSPEHAYFQGCSGGGRQALMQAQRYPGDYDGIWSANPAINWTKFLAAELWPGLVMQEERNALSPAKLELFRAAAILAREGAGGTEHASSGEIDQSDFDPSEIVGQQCDDGVITEEDAVVMRKIWDGPRRSSGELLWFGLRRGTESWGNNLSMTGLCLTTEASGDRLPVPFPLAESWMRWVAHDPNLSLSDINYARFEELFDRGVEEFADVATDDPDLTGFRDQEAKLIVSHGLADELIFADGSVEYYERVMREMGGREATTSFVRLFLTEGDGHSDCVGPGPGVSIAAGMLALMNWVENGVAPAEIVAVAVDPATGAVQATRPTYPYPLVSRYSGSGDPTSAENFVAGRP